MADNEKETYEYRVEEETDLFDKTNYPELFPGYVKPDYSNMYEIIRKYPNSDLNKILNSWGKNGWKLIKMESNNYSTGLFAYKYIFQRKSLHNYEFKLLEAQNPADMEKQLTDYYNQTWKIVQFLSPTAVYLKREID